MTLMDGPPRARPETDPEVAAWQVVDGLEHTVAVEVEGRFLGWFPPTHSWPCSRRSTKKTCRAWVDR